MNTLFLPNIGTKKDSGNGTRIANVYKIPDSWEVAEKAAFLRKVFHRPEPGETTISRNQSYPLPICKGID